jgi:hypothetical protein
MAAGNTKTFSTTWHTHRGQAYLSRLKNPPQVCQAPSARKPASILGIRMAYKLSTARYNEYRASKKALGIQEPKAFLLWQISCCYRGVLSLLCFHSAP